MGGGVTTRPQFDITSLKLPYYALTRCRWTGSRFSESDMKQRFILLQRGGDFYSGGTTTGKQTSLGSKDPDEARTLLSTRYEATRQPNMNVQINDFTGERSQEPRREARGDTHTHSRMARPGGFQGILPVEGNFTTVRGLGSWRFTCHLLSGKK